MLAFFPHPYPDEILYSVFARYHCWSGNISAKETLKELFGSTTVSAVVDLPSHLQALIDRMPAGACYTARELIVNHTMFPFYAPFMPDNRAENVFNAMCSNKGNSIHLETGIVAGKILVPSFLRFCPQCIQDDKEKWGEAYWHRVHQIPGVMVCPIHGVPIYDSSVKIHGLNKHAFVSVSKEVCHIEREIQYSDALKEKLMKIAMEVKWLLAHHEQILSCKNFQKDYSLLLKQKELIKGKSTVDQESLAEQFLVFYGQEVLKILQSEVDYDENCWLRMIVRKHRKSFHPIRHILIMNFLAGSLEGAIKNNIRAGPFGEGPWPCLNAASDHYQQNLINYVIITICSDTRKPVGTFTCSCGFVYSRRGPDKMSTDRFHIGRIKTFGAVWETELRHLVEDEKLSMRETARRLKVDVNTVKKYATILDMKPSWHEKKTYQIELIDKKVEEYQETPDMLEYNRIMWLEQQVNFPHEGSTAIRKRIPTTYMWLYRHDHQWLKEHQLFVKRNKLANKRVDWEKRDKELLAKVQELVRKNQESNMKPIRITLSYIGKMIGALSLLQKMKDKLPLTINYLVRHVETTEQFQIRRIYWAVDMLLLEDAPIDPWRVIRKAGLRSEVALQFAEVIRKVVVNADSLRRGTPYLN